jgi:opacity protein-like surface antigen
MKHPCLRVLGYAVLALSLSGPAAATNPLEVYFGGAIGQAQVDANVPPDPFLSPSSKPFKETHAAYKGMIGVRPVSFLGAELAYMNFGNPSGSLFGYPAHGSTKGASAFGLLYLPIPVLDVYAKAGLARIQSQVSGLMPTPSNICSLGLPCGTVPFKQDGTNTGFATGLGAQVTFGSWAVRAEFERFDAAGENPYFASVALTWTFR